MNTKQAIILAGGLGTRLQPVLPDIPKCMAPVHGLPFLTYVFNYLEKYRIEEVILSVGYLKDHIINHFGYRYNSISITYSVENEPLGTGGAIKLALTQCSDNEVFILNGDTFFVPDLHKMELDHDLYAADITIAAKQMLDADRYGLVTINNTGRITAFLEKQYPSSGGWINGGIYLLKKQLFETFPLEKFSLEKDLYAVSCEKLNIYAFQTEAFFLDMGIPQDYAKAQTVNFDTVL